MRDRRYEAIVLGASAGGLHALSVVIDRLGPTFSLPVIAVQHVHPRSKIDFPALFEDKVRKKTGLRIVEAEEKQAIASGFLYLAPPNYHLLVEMDRTLSLSVDEPVQWARPSIDVLFETAAKAYGDALVGVLLTGANQDGARGLKAIHDAGGATLVQDPATAEVSSMPRAALKLFEPSAIVTLEDMGFHLARLALNEAGGEARGEEG